MHSQQILAALALAAPLVYSSPLDLSKRGQGTFHVDQVPKSMKSTKNAASAYMKALGKYKATIPSHVSQAAAVQSGSATATPQGDDLEYTVPVTIGSGQTLQLDFDTGSSDLWVFSTETPSNEASGHTTYDPSGATKLPDTWSISYGDGSGASGDVYADKVVVGAVTATSQAVEAATSVSAGSFDGSDGLLGLASSSINTVTPDQQTTFFDTVKSTLAAPVFTATLKHQAPGSYDFGYIDNSKYTGTINYVPVDFSQGFWMFDTDGYSVAGGSSGSFGSAIADTGTTLLLAPTDAVTAYYNAVPSAQDSQEQGGYVVDCGATLPDFTITLGGADATVPGSLINYEAVGDGTCFGGIQDNQGLGFSILGDIFLKSQFAVFDSGNTQFGVAPQA